MYNNAEYAKALEYYQRILDSGKHSAELYFNMGNAHYKLENVAESIYFYEKALLLSPGDAEIKNNLGYAQNMRLDAIEKLPKTALQQFYSSTVSVLSMDQWAYLSVFFIIAFILCFSTYYLLNIAIRKRVFFIGGNVFLLCSFTLFFVCRTKSSG